MDGGPAASFNVFFYPDSGGLPGARGCNPRGAAVFNAAGDLHNVNRPAVVLLQAPIGSRCKPGWTLRRAASGFGPIGWLYRTSRAVVEKSRVAALLLLRPAQPLGAARPCPACTSYGVRQCCNGSPVGEPDQMFRLIGTIGGGTTYADPDGDAV